AARRAAGGVGPLIRYGPHLPGHGASDERFEAAMPVPDPAPLDPADDAPPPGDVLCLPSLGGGGCPRDAMSPGKTVARMAARLCVSGPDRYRLEFSSRSGRNAPRTIPC